MLHPSTPVRAAHWLIAKYHPVHGDARFLPRALECGVCTLDTLLVIERIFRDESASQDTTTHPTPWFGITAPAPDRTLLCATLPKRLFRPPTASTLPFLTHLLTTYAPSPNSHRGYPLSRAVLASDTRLIALLLASGADPSARDFLAVEIALKRRDLDSLRLLIDGPPPATAASPKPPSSGPPAKRRKPNNDHHQRGVKLSQQMVDTALTKGTPEIIQYIIHEKGTFLPGH